MAWTTPGTAVAGDVLTASFWNSNVRDNLNSVGFIHVNTTTFSAASSVTVDSVFNSTYRNYRIVIDSLSGSTGNYLHMIMRAGGVDKTSNSYYGAATRPTYSGTTSVITNSAGTTGFLCGDYSSTASWSVSELTLFEPFVSIRTTANVSAMNKGLAIGWTGNFLYAVDESHDGFKLSPVSGGTITGVVRVYGIRNS